MNFWTLAIDELYTIYKTPKAILDFIEMTVMVSPSNPCLIEIVSFDRLRMTDER